MAQDLTDAHWVFIEPLLPELPPPARNVSIPWKVAAYSTESSHPPDRSDSDATTLYKSLN